MRLLMHSLWRIRWVCYNGIDVRHFYRRERRLEVFRLELFRDPRLEGFRDFRLELFRDLDRDRPPFL